MSQDKNNLKSECMFLLWLTANGATTGLFIKGFQIIASRDYNIDNDMALYMMSMLIAMAISADRAKYWYLQKNQNTK